MLRFSTLGICALTAAFGGSSLPALADVVWTADGTRSLVTLSVSHLLIAKITGTIPIASATIVTADAETVPLLIDAILDAASLDTHDLQRDAQLRSERFFDVAHFPKITFASERVLETGPGTFLVEGELTMRGVTRPITFETRLVFIRRDHDGKRRARYESVGHFRRSDYGMTYARGIVGNDVRLEIAIEATS